MHIEENDDLFDEVLLITNQATRRLLQKSMSSPKSSIGGIFLNNTIDSRLKHAGMTAFLYFCKGLILQPITLSHHSGLQE